MALDPRIAHLMDARILLGLLPHVDQSHLWEIRREFARALTASNVRQSETWQEAWNMWTSATPERPGQVRYTPARCTECHGRGFSHRNISRNLARTGHPGVCGGCRGTRKGTSQVIAARHASVPVCDDTKSGETP